MIRAKQPKQHSTAYVNGLLAYRMGSLYKLYYKLIPSESDPTILLQSENVYSTECDTAYYLNRTPTHHRTCVFKTITFCLMGRVFFRISNMGQLLGVPSLSFPPVASPPFPSLPSSSLLSSPSCPPLSPPTSHLFPCHPVEVGLGPLNFS